MSKLNLLFLALLVVGVGFWVFAGHSKSETDSRQALPGATVAKFDLQGLSEGLDKCNAA